MILSGLSTTVVTDFAATGTPVIFFIAVSDTADDSFTMIERVNRLGILERPYAGNVHFNTVIEDAVRFHICTAEHLASSLSVYIPKVQTRK